MNCSKCGWHHPKNPKCSFKSICDIGCSQQDKHYRLFCPKFCKVSNVTSKVVSNINVVPEDPQIAPQVIEQVNVIPDLIHSVNLSKSVALPTGIFSAMNSDALKLPVDQKNVSTLVD